MAEQDYFKRALSDFTHEAASGGAIRHLADLGYTVKQIREQLTFPTPYERVQKAVWERLLDTGVILLEEPGSGKRREKTDYVVEHDRYGRTSFRRLPALPKEDGTETVFLRERKIQEAARFPAAGGGTPAGFLSEKCRENGENNSYISCDFGLQIKRNEEEFRKAMELLTQRQREYIQGLPWERKRCYHRLDLRMREIMVRLYEEGHYHGACYFLKSREKVVF